MSESQWLGFALTSLFGGLWVVIPREEIAMAGFLPASLIVAASLVAILLLTGVLA